MTWCVRPVSQARRTASGRAAFPTSAVRFCSRPSTTCWSAASWTAALSASASGSSSHIRRMRRPSIRGALRCHTAKFNGPLWAATLETTCNFTTACCGDYFCPWPICRIFYRLVDKSRQFFGFYFHPFQHEILRGLLIKYTVSIAATWVSKTIIAMSVALDVSL